MKNKDIVTPQERVFVDEYMRTGNGTEAMRKARPEIKDPADASHYTLKKENIRKYMQERAKEYNLVFAKHIPEAVQRTLEIMRDADKDSTSLEACKVVCERGGMGKGENPLPLNINYYDRYTLNELKERVRSLLVEEGKAEGEEEPLLPDNNGSGVQRPDKDPS